MVSKLLFATQSTPIIEGVLWDIKTDSTLLHFSQFQ
jgi:hypothetical protein